MNLRQHKRAKQPRLAHLLAMRRLVSVQAHDRIDFFYDDEADDLGYDCTHCGGEGYCQVDDPFWDDCDEYGYGPCTYCDGTGDRSHQTVF